MKQVIVEVELQKNSPNNVVANTQKTVVEELVMEQVTPELVLRRSSRTMRVPNMYVTSLYYGLLTLMRGN